MYTHHYTYNILVLLSKTPEYQPDISKMASNRPRWLSLIINVPIGSWVSISVPTVITSASANIGA